MLIRRATPVIAFIMASFSIPGATGLVRISSITRPYRPEPLHLVVNKLPPHYDGSPLYLQLGYEDDDYGDNGYYKHDNGNDSQCRCDRDENRPRIEFITEISNLFNHANFASVNDVIGPDPTAADYNIGSFRLKGLRTRQITEPLGFNSAFEARRIQFGVKFIFK